MKIQVLASGSKGNVTLIQTKNTNILIDFGLSYRLVNEKLKSVSKTINDIDAILITHEHSDHIKGLNTLIKNKKIPIYLSQGTYEAIIDNKKIPEYDNYHIINSNEELLINDIDVQPFLVSHDANEPFGYVIHHNEKKMVHLTDTGFVSQNVEELIKNADIYVLETNHNIEMLMSSTRPWYLKQRILGDLGHLCNEDALEVLNRVKGEKTKYVYLAHISEEANNKDLLLLTVKNYFSKCHLNIKFLIAYQEQISQCVEV